MLSLQRRASQFDLEAVSNLSNRNVSAPHIYLHASLLLGEDLQDHRDSKPQVHVNTFAD